MKTAIDTINELEAIISDLRKELKESHLRTDRLREQRDGAKLTAHNCPRGCFEVGCIYCATIGFPQGFGERYWEYGQWVHKVPTGQYTVACNAPAIPPRWTLTWTEGRA
jgi:hypothetical protein